MDEEPVVTAKDIAYVKDEYKQWQQKQDQTSGKITCQICESVGVETRVKGIVGHIKTVHGLPCTGTNLHMYNVPMDQQPDPKAVLKPSKKKAKGEAPGCKHPKKADPPPPPPVSESEDEDPLGDGPKSRTPATQPKHVCPHCLAEHTNPLLHMLQHVKPEALDQFFKTFWGYVKESYPYASDSGIFKAIMTGEIPIHDVENVMDLLMENFEQIPSSNSCSFLFDFLENCETFSISVP
jgi:hypothetical protein